MHIPERDNVEEHYNIRRLDNRYRVVCSERAVVPNRFIVSVERLHDDHWHHVAGTAGFGSLNRLMANARIIELYETFKPME